MRARTKVLRTVTVLGSGLLLLAASAGATVARTELFTIEIDLDTNTETVKSDSALLCAEGDAITDFDRAAGNFNQAGTFHLTKLIVCDGGTFVIRVDAASNFVTGGGTTGGWNVVPGSGTGDFVGLTGGGTVVGVNSDAAPIDLFDHYYGSLRIG
jgi:hypothetical protein